MVDCWRSTFSHLMNNCMSPTALFATLVKSWASEVVEYEAFVSGRSLHASVNVDISALVETSRPPFEIMRILAGRLLEVLDSLALLRIDGYRVVTLLH